MKPKHNIVNATTRTLPISINWLAVYFVAHIILGYIMLNYPMVSTLHAWLTLMVTSFIAISSRQPHKTAYAIAYIAGADVLWRMTQAYVFWEMGKYAITVVAGLYLLKNIRRLPLLPFFYFVLLLPSILLLPENMPPSENIRQLVSFNLSGPLALLMCVLFFYKSKYTMAQLYKLIIISLGPILAVTFLAALSTYTAEEIIFVTESMTVTSGGYGPNQVSGTIGLGVYFVYIMVIALKRNNILRILLIMLGIWMLAQCLLTFSRGGVYSAIIAIIFMSTMAFKSVKVMIRYIVVMLILFVVINNYVLPKILEFTHGTLQQRYTKSGYTGRDQLAKDDYRIFKENPLMGVGPGLAEYSRPQYFHTIHTHTEFTRLLAEHGGFGLISLIILVFIALNNIKATKGPIHRALVLSSLSWSVAFMLVYAMRSGAPAFLFGLSGIMLIEDSAPPKRKTRGS